MLSELNYNNIEIVGDGSSYDVNNGKQKRGLAFYYSVNGKKQPRKVFTASSDEECFKKAKAFLDKIEKECEDKKYTINRISTTDRPRIRDFVYVEDHEPVKMTFKEVGDKWYEDYSRRLNKKRNGISYSTLESRDLAYRTMCKRIGDMYMEDITQDVADDLVEYFSYKEDGSMYSFSYVDKLQQTFHMIIDYAKGRNWYHYDLETTPLNYLEKANTDARFLDREQVAEVKSILINNDRYHLVVDIIMASGLRQEELFALTINDFKTVSNKSVEIHVNNSVREVGEYKYKIVPYGKTDRSRRVVTIPYSVYNKVVDYFDDLTKKETSYEKKLRQQNGTVGLIFADKEKKVPNKRTFERSFANYLKRQLKKLGKSLDYEVTLHMFRHSYASLMAETLPVEVVAKLLGDTIETTEKNYYSMSKVVKQNVSVSSENIIKSIEDIMDSIDDE